MHPAWREVQHWSEDLGDVVALVGEEELLDDHVEGVERVELKLHWRQSQPGGATVGVGAVELPKDLGGLKSRLRYRVVL